MANFQLGWFSSGEFELVLTNEMVDCGRVNVLRDFDSLIQLVRFVEGDLKLGNGSYYVWRRTDLTEQWRVL